MTANEVLLKQDRSSNATLAGSRMLTQLSTVNSIIEDPEALAILQNAKRLKINVREIREQLSMSQQEFAGRFGISIGTLRNWEQGVREPEGPARAYLTVIKNDPAAVIKALAKSE